LEGLAHLIRDFFNSIDPKRTTVKMNVEFESGLLGRAH
jgi:hypothetical protein